MIEIQNFFNSHGYAVIRNVLDPEIAGLVYQYCITKVRRADYLLENYYEIQNNPEVLNTSFTDGPEYFNIFIKHGDVTICHHQVDAKVFPPKIRYTVDIRPHIKSLLFSLTDIFSAKNLTYEYDGYSLKPSYL